MKNKIIHKTGSSSTRTLDDMLYARVYNMPSKAYTIAKNKIDSGEVEEEQIFLEDSSRSQPFKSLKPQGNLNGDDIHHEELSQMEDQANKENNGYAEKHDQSEHEEPSSHKENAKKSNKVAQEEANELQ